MLVIADDFLLDELYSSGDNLTVVKSLVQQSQTEIKIHFCVCFSYFGQNDQEDVLKLYLLIVFFKVITLCISVNLWFWLTLLAIPMWVATIISL